ncbi:Hsp33 family molecular chaperone HslO [Ligilactobacillus sp. WILCCON 0076]|uniref:33 kDa chaperonin n=1 Tax=Ligilactobacillus ubinensis TaxID=2876789 RepID=A0A9X2FJB7_9LACO|nr:Hsp33 family molecular chaperone HslO [Ligilactobacillus ubinensis]MCP0886822.1 Hsp33 family molecular chaperone HslO [Ligilactobacillus ubinensis]
MADYLVKSLVYEGQLRAYAVDATQIVREAQKKQDTWSAASAALGRTLVGTILLSAASLKDEGKMTVRINGDGPVGGIVVDANYKGEVKGYIQHPHIHLPLNNNHKIDVKGAVGTTGFLSVTKDLGLKEPFTGQVDLVSGELGEDFTYYLAKSEQIPSAVGLSVFVNEDNSIETAGGFMIQVLPGAQDEILNKLEKRLQNMEPISTIMRKKKAPEDILKEIFTEKNIKFLSKEKFIYKCDCSKKRFAQILATLPVGDIEEMIAQDHGAQAICHFCGNKYNFSEEELKEIVQRSKA